MTPLIFWYSVDQAEDHTAATAEDIDLALDHVASLADRVGAVAEITRSGDVIHDCLYAGLMGEHGVLHFIDADGGVYSTGTGPADAAAATVYDLMGNVMLFPPDAELPAEDVRAAVQEYARTGSRPGAVRWQTWSAPREPAVGPTRLR